MWFQSSEDLIRLSEVEAHDSLPMGSEKYAEMVGNWAGRWLIRRGLSQRKPGVNAPFKVTGVGDTSLRASETVNWQ